MNFLISCNLNKVFLLFFFNDVFVDFRESRAGILSFIGFHNTWFAVNCYFCISLFDSTEPLFFFSHLTFNRVLFGKFSYFGLLSI